MTREQECLHGNPQREALQSTLPDVRTCIRFTFCALMPPVSGLRCSMRTNAVECIYNPRLLITVTTARLIYVLSECLNALNTIRIVETEFIVTRSPPLR